MRFLFLMVSLSVAISKLTALEKSIYLDFDNRTRVGQEEIDADPLILLRSKTNFEQATFHLQSKVRAPIIVNTSHVFDHSIPHFELKQARKNPQKIRWQISSDENFLTVIPNFEGMQDSCDEVHLDRLADTFINSGQTYFFRARALYDDGWTDWSLAFPFFAIKPSPVLETNIERIDESHYRLSWNNENDENTHYWVFGSSSIDFVPSIYSEKEGFFSTEDFQEVTDTNSIVIDNTLPYYRIIAESRGFYSTPSHLIKVKGHAVSQPAQVSLPIKLLTPNNPMAKLLQPLAKKTKKTKTKKTKTKKKKEANTGPFVKSPYVSNEVWAQVKPHLLPTTFSLRKKLDKLFAKFRVVHDANSLLRAGFDTPNERPYSHTIVSTNRKLSGYYFKMFTDIQGGILDWQMLLTRIHGAQSLERAIKRHGFEKLFCVPKKWLYPIPPTPDAAPNTERKNFILVAEDMKLLKKYESYARWKSSSVTPKLLDAVYIILQEEGLVDSPWAFNMPFTKDGRIAFIDTERHHQWPIPFGYLLKYLNPEMQEYWQKLIDQKGPKGNR